MNSPGSQTVAHDESPSPPPKLAPSDSLAIPRRRDRWFGRLAVVQGVFYAVTGVWPIVHLRSFLVVTGPKTDLWLVQTVGALLTVVGCVLWRAGVRRAITAELFILAVGAATVLAAVDFIFVARNVISPIYLLDAAAELTLVLAWLICAAINRTRSDRP